MKQKNIMKKLLYFIFTCVLVLCGGCFQQADNSSSWQNEYWSFSYPANNVKEIKIVEVGLPKDYYVVGMWAPEDCVVKEVDIAYAGELYQDVENMDMEQCYTSSPTGKAILIVYNNGEKDLFTSIGPSQFLYEKNVGRIVVNKQEVKCCNQEDFDALINKYLNLP